MPSRNSSKLFRSRSQRLALEPRIVFDGAIGATAWDAHHTDAGHDGHALAAEAEPNRTAAPDRLQTGAAEPARGTEVIFVDARVAGLQAFLDAHQQSEVIVLDPNRDGVTQIAETLAGRTGVSTVQILSHGDAGRIELGNGSLDAQGINGRYAADMAVIKSALTESADILVYGCDVAAGAEGQAFVEALAAATGADIAASTDPTGAARLGGNWVLETASGGIEAATLALTGFDGTLTTAPSITDSGAATPRATPEDIALAITGVTVADADNPAVMSASFNVTGGTISLAGSGWTVTAGSNGSSAVTIQGTASQINAALNGMSFTPDANQNSTVSGYLPKIDISVSDITNSDGPTTLSITNLSVSPVNDAPTMSGGTATVPEGGSLNASSPSTVGQGFYQSQLGLTDVDSLAVQTIAKITALPTRGTLMYSGSPVLVGTTFALSDIANMSYVHDGSQVAPGNTDTFSLTIDDGAGGILTNQLVTVNLTPVNQPPSVGGSVTVIEGETGVRLDDNGLLPTLGTPRGAISVSDPEGAAINTYTIASLPAHGTLLYNGSPITTGFVVNDITLLTYSHDGSETTADSFDISVTDDGGGTSTPATTTGTVNLQIHPNDDDPVLATNVTQTLSSGSTLTVTPAMLQVTDSDSPNANLTYTLTAVPNPADGYFMLSGQTLVVGATFTQADIAAGNLVYVTRSNTPRTDSISFTVKDGDYRIYPNVREGGIYDTPAQTSPLTVNTFRVTISDTVTPDPNPAPGPAPVNTAPAISGTNSASLLEGETITLSSTMLAATDSDNSPTERVYRLQSLPSSGSVRLNGSALVVGQTFTQDDVNNGRVSFSHAGNEDFIDSFTYTVSDGLATTAAQTFSLSITPQNDTPAAATTGESIAEGASLTLTTSHIALSDADNSNSDNETGYAANQSLGFLITGNVAHGTLELNGVNVVPGTTVVTSADLAAGKLVYTHDGSETTYDSFKLRPLDSANVGHDGTGATGGDPVTATNHDSLGAEVTMPITIAPMNDALAYFSKSQLINGQAGAIQEGATATIGGATSYAIINGVPGTGTPTPATGAHLSFGDTDNTAVQRQYRITAAPVNGQLLLNGSPLGVGSSFTQDDLDNGRITYKHNGSENTTTDAFSYVVSDGDWTANDAQSFPQGTPPTPSTYHIEITPRNDVPTLAAPATLDAFAAGTGTTSITGVSVADLDLADGIQSGETDFIRIEVQVLDSADALVAGAQLNYTAADPSGGNAYVSGKVSNSLIVQGTKAQVDAVLASLTVAFTSDADASDYKIRVTADDRLYDNTGNLTSGANGGPGPDNADGTPINAADNRVTKDIALRASNFNDPPTISNASGAYTVNEDAQVTLTGFTVSDADSFGEDVTATVRLYSDSTHTTLANAGTEGRLLLGSTTGLTSFSGNGTNTITLTGSLAEVQAALNDLKFAGAPNYNGTGVGTSNLYLQTTLADFTHADGQKTATVDNTITIVPVNDAPTLSVPGDQTLSSGTSITLPPSFAVGDAADIGQGATDFITVTVAATESGSPYGEISVTASGGATVTNNGTATVTITGTTADVQATLNAMTYTPDNPNVNSTVLITVTADDRTARVGNGKEGVGVDGNNTTVKTFNIIVSNVNEAPVLTAPATLTVNEDTSNNAVVGVSFTDSDDFGAVEQVTLDLGTSPKGTISLGTTTGLTFSVGDGTNDTKMVFTGTKAALNAALASLTFTPTGNINTVGAGNEQPLVITVDDQGHTGTGGALTDTKTVQITITPVNDAPTRSAGPFVSLAGVQEDSTNPPGDTVSNLFGPAFSDATDQVSGGSNANTLAGVAITFNAATPAQGVWQYSTDGGATWTDLPAVSDTSAFVVAAGDKLRFLPHADWNGHPGGLVTRLIDSSAGPVTTGSVVDVTGSNSGGTTQYSDTTNTVDLYTAVFPVNDAPVASGTASLAAVNEDTTNPPGVPVSTLITGANYSDATDEISPAAGPSSHATPLGGIAIVGNSANPATEGAWQYSTDGGTTWTAVPTSSLGDTTALILPATAQLRFVPVADYHGTPGALSVRLADSAQAFSASSDISGQLGGTHTWSAAAIPITTTVTPVNDAPVNTVPGAQSTTEDTNLAMTGLLVADVDSASLTTTLSLPAGAGTLTVTGGSGATITGDGTGTVTLTGSAAQINAALASVTYTPTPDYNTGTGTINLTIATTDGALTDTNTVAIAVTPVADIVDDSVTTPEDTPVNISVLANDSFEGTPTVTAVGTASHGTVSLVGSTVTYTPNANYTGTDSFTYTVTSGGVTETATVNVTVTPVNDDFTDADETVSIAEDTTASGNVLTGTSSVDGPVSVASFTIAGEAGPFVVGTPYTIAGKGNLTLNSDGSYSFTPVANWNGAVPLVTYTVTDGSGTDDTSTLAITVTPVGDLTASDDSAITSEDTPVTASVAGNDSTTSGGTLSFAKASDPAHGTVTMNANGSYTYTPAADWNGTDSFTYTVTDAASGESLTRTVTLTVIPVNDDFTDADETVSIAEDTTASGNVLTGTSSVDGPVSVASFTIAGEAGPFVVGTPYTIAGKGNLTLNSDGSYSFTPVANWNGAVPLVTYTVTDGSGTDDTSTLAITVTPVGDLTASDDSAITSEDTPVTASVAGNDSTTSGGTLSFAKASDPAHGTVTMNANGSYTYTPAADWNGTDSFTYTVTDAASGESLTRTVTLTVTPVADIANDAATTNEDTAVTISVLANDSFQGTPVVTAVTQGAHGTVVNNGDGTVTYTPDSGWSGTDSYTYTVTSGGVTETATVNVTVRTASAPQTREGDRFFKDGNRLIPKIPPIQATPALYVLPSVNDARNEMSLGSGLGIFQADSVTTAELVDAADPGLAFAAGLQDGPGGLSGRDFSPLQPLHRGVLDQPEALYVQRAVRHQPLAMDHTLHVQGAVRASQLESAARNARVDAYNSATPGMVTLFDPFALGAPWAEAGRAIRAVDTVDDGKAELTQPSAPGDAQIRDDDHMASAQGSDLGDISTPPESGPPLPRAAVGFSSQLQRLAADFRPRTPRQAAAQEGGVNNQVQHP